MTTATYSAEDNKIRIYLSRRLSAEDYAPIKKAGFQSAPKQGCVFAVWSPEREDLALELAGEIVPEETTMAERAEAKAERLEALAHKAAQKSQGFFNAAQKLSERFYMGQPILIGHHSERKARRDHARSDALMRQSVKSADAVNYWNYKATGVERHANYKNRDDVRARRIKTLLAELRSLQRPLNEAFKHLEAWENCTPENAQTLAGFHGFAPLYLDKPSVYSQLQAGTMTPEEAIETCIKFHISIIEGENRKRWIMHTLNRLAYERSELGEVARYEGELTPVILQAFLREYGADKPKVDASLSATCTAPLPLFLQPELSESLSLSDTDWRDLMHNLGYEVPAAKPSKAGTQAPLINPSREEAERLQAYWANGGNVEEMTQAEYTRKNEYQCASAIGLNAQGAITRKKSEAVCRIRVQHGYMYRSHVIVLTDKPSKPLPIDWEV